MVQKPAWDVRTFPYRGAARVLLGIGLLSFVLPFATVSCGGHDVITANGFNAIAGGPYNVSGQSQGYSGDASFLLAFVGAVVALICLFVPLRVSTQSAVSGLASLWSAVMLLTGLAHVNSELVDLNSRGLVTVRWDAGFWIALVAFGAGALVMALRIYGDSARAPSEAPDSAAPGFRFSWPTSSMAGTMQRSVLVMVGALLAFVAAVMIIIACATPYIHYTDPTFQPATQTVFNPGFAPSNWFAAEPVGVAVLAFAAAVVLALWPSRIPRAMAAGILLAYGAQTFLLFLGYVVLAVKSPSAQLEPGGVIGMAAGALMFVGALPAVFSLFSAPRREPAAPELAEAIPTPSPVP